MYSRIMSLLVRAYSGSRGIKKFPAHLHAVLKTHSTTQTTTGFGSTVSKFILPARSWELLENVNIFYRYEREAYTKAYFLGGMGSWKSSPSPQSCLGKAPRWRREGFHCWPSWPVKQVQKLGHYLSSLKFNLKKSKIILSTIMLFNLTIICRSLGFSLQLVKYMWNSHIRQNYERCIIKDIKVPITHTTHTCTHQVNENQFCLVPSQVSWAPHELP